MDSIEQFFDGAEEQETDSRMQRLLTHNEAVRDHWQLVTAIKGALAADDYIDAAMTWNAAPEDVKHALWVAPTKGGIFTTQERQKIKSNEMHHATQSQFMEKSA